MKIPFNRPYLGDKEISAAAKAIKSGCIAGNGQIGRRVEELMRKKFKIGHFLLTTSCTHALEMALMALGIKEDDEVVLPSYNFVSAANVIVRLKAKPIFVDIHEDDLNIDPQKIKEAITKKTKAIICMHYGGIGCNMSELLKISKSNKIYIIEDAAQAVGSKYKSDFLGTIGDIGCFSFHGTKNLTCGEGGAFLTNDKQIADKAEIIREKGTNRAAFMCGEVDKYTWVDIGSSYVLSDILAAILYEQFNKLSYIINERRKLGLRYLERLSELEKKGKIILPKIPDEDINWHLFYFRVRNQKERDPLLRKLKERGIQATFHFLPLHLSRYARKSFGYRKGDFPISERVSDTLIRLPLYPTLKESEQDYIIESIFDILK